MTTEEENEQMSNVALNITYGSIAHGKLDNNSDCNNSPCNS